MTTTLTPEALRALRCAEIDGNRLVLPDQLPRKVYEEVDKALTRLGGKWNRSARAHLFDGGPRAALAPVFDDGMMPRDADRDAAFFRTPPEVADRVIHAAGLHNPVSMRVLEPSAGDGALADAARSLYPWRTLDLVCIEPDRGRYEALAAKGHDARLETFEEYVANRRPDAPRFAAVMMNPPFATPGHPVLWAEHILLAWDLLAPGGTLASVIPPALTRRHRTVAQLRGLVDDYGRTENLPAGAFKTSGTSTSTALLVIERP